jgi:activator of HSP90 ATPase
MDIPVTRRRMGLLLASLGASSAYAQDKKTGTTLHFEVDYKTTPHKIYQVLLDAKEFSACTGVPAEIDPKVGGAFKLFGGQIEGRNIELVPDKRVVQAWRPAYWTAGVYSIVKFELVATGTGARIVCDHAGFAENLHDSLAEGWQDHYWGPLHKYLNA